PPLLSPRAETARSAVRFATHPWKRMQDDCLLCRRGRCTPGLLGPGHLMPAFLQITSVVADLTPFAPMPMGGQGGPERLSRNTHGRLEGNIVTLGEGPGAVVL